MKKLIAILLLAVTAMLSSFAFVACDMNAIFGDSGSTTDKPADDVTPSTPDAPDKARTAVRPAYTITCPKQPRLPPRRTA